MDLKNYELAEQDYMDGMKYKEIAAKYGVTLNTVKSWKTRYKWDKKCVHTKKRNVRTQKIEEKQRKIEAAEVVEQVLTNEDLNDRQQLFCLYYAKTFNATKAYQKAYGCTYESAMARSCVVMKDKRIKDEIQGKDGAKIKLADRMKALDWLAGHMDLATPEQAARVEKLKAETVHIRGDDPDEQAGDDGVVDALKMEANELWEDE